jgi:hypothetical protein
MPAPIILKIDLRKIPDEWVFKGAKGDYADCVAYENDEIDQYGNSHVIKLSPPRELRDQGVKPIIIGNGKWMPQKGGTRPAPRQQTRPAPRLNALRRQPPGTIQYPEPQPDNGDDDIF